MSSSRPEPSKRFWENMEDADSSSSKKEDFKRRRSEPAASADGAPRSLPMLPNLSRASSELPLGTLLSKLTDSLQKSVQRFRDVAKRELRRLQSENQMDALTAAKMLVQSIRTASEPSTPPHDEIEIVMAKGAPDEDVAIWAILVKDELQKLRVHGTQTSDAVEILVSRMERLSANSVAALQPLPLINPRKRSSTVEPSTASPSSRSEIPHLPSQPKRSRSIPAPEPTPAPAATSSTSVTNSSLPNNRKRSTRTENSSNLSVLTNNDASVEEMHPIDQHLKRVRSVTFVEPNSN